MNSVRLVDPHVPEGYVPVYNALLQIPSMARNAPCQRDDISLCIMPFLPIPSIVRNASCRREDMPCGLINLETAQSKLYSTHSQTVCLCSLLSKASLYRRFKLVSLLLWRPTAMFVIVDLNSDASFFLSTT